MAIPNKTEYLMKTEYFQFSGGKGLVLPAILWLPDGLAVPRAIVQITHGMTEHIGRYTGLAQALTAAGIAVAGFDLRGHGQNPSQCGVDCASFGEGGWDDSLADMQACSVCLRTRFPNVPYFMLGFSLGSFLLREYLNCYREPIAGAVIVGTGQQPAAILSVMLAIMKAQIKKTGFNATTALVKKFSFEMYNQKFAPNRTSMDWLCADEKELDAYLDDSLCQSGISTGLFWQLLGAMKRTGKKDAYERWNPKMPVLLLSGQKDTVGDNGKGVIRIKEAMKKAGLKETALHLLPEARHDVFHEESTGCAEQARKILLEWIKKWSEVVSL